MTRTSAHVIWVVGLLVAGPAPATDAGNSPDIVVQGTGSVSAAPDRIQFQTGAVTVEPTAARALSENSDVLRRLRATLADFGVPDENVQTQQLTLSAEYDRKQRPNEQRTIVGYRVTHVLQIELRELEAVGALLDALVREGASVLQSIRFSVAEPDVLLDRARRAAVADARRKAELLAEEAGVELGPVLEIREGAGRPIEPLPRSFAAEATAVPVAPGERTYTATVTVRYAIGRAP
ncbi:MAG: DUF541 domain-containing protein [Gammaproteobacteria bacterium]|nr:DUF541 domain-containing protein [Gammaproteobacteria bacterium]NIR83547.1 DUF541 domain-containing protein [Gammaproteobacteria bacterium]NIR91469.1 DUF541 domain-containing protein [Gammaproteobacteria bacterium]NIU04709.1 DUF541 domain-containing protein [Gammaproteobacteria bacterium]NIV51751.1 DUF541 domain-containing protein [Gammaproteobacteria bacterium]